MSIPTKELRELKELLDDGVINKSEFNKLKKQLLSDALSPEELENDLFGDPYMNTADIEEKKTDKFDTLYRKNEELQKKRSYNLTGTDIEKNKEDYKKPSITPKKTLITIAAIVIIAILGMLLTDMLSNDTISEETRDKSTDGLDTEVTDAYKTEPEEAPVTEPDNEVARSAFSEFMKSTILDADSIKEGHPVFDNDDRFYSGELEKYAIEDFDGDGQIEMLVDASYIDGDTFFIYEYNGTEVVESGRIFAPRSFSQDDIKSSLKFFNNAVMLEYDITQELTSEQEKYNNPTEFILTFFDDRYKDYINENEAFNFSDKTYKLEYVKIDNGEVSRSNGGSQGDTITVEQMELDYQKYTSEGDEIFPDFRDITQEEFGL